MIATHKTEQSATAQAMMMSDEQRTQGPTVHTIFSFYIRAPLDIGKKKL